jgi:hypothetical protein
MSHFVICSSELPVSPEDLLPLIPATVLTGLGPVISEPMLEMALDSLNQGGRLFLFSLLGRPGLEALVNPDRHPNLYKHLRPIACSFTELRLADEQIQRLPSDPRLANRVQSRYVSNLMADFARAAASPEAAQRISGGYWNSSGQTMVWCPPLQRQLTPPFGKLSMIGAVPRR